MLRCRYKLCIFINNKLKIKYKNGYAKKKKKEEILANICIVNKISEIGECIRIANLCKVILYEDYYVGLAKKKYT